MCGLTACAAPTPVTGIPEVPTSTIAQAPTRPAPIQTDLPTIQFTIQVGAFSTTARASRFAAELQQQGLDAYYFIDEDGLCKVRFDRFEEKARARRRAFELQALGRIDDFYIVQPGAGTRYVNPQMDLRRSIVQTAQRFVGTSYRWGGASAARGFDCSGLTMTVYRLNGLELPRHSRSQFSTGTPIQRNSLKEGDLVFFATNDGKRVSHVGIYTGGNKFIHAPGRGKRIRTASLSNGYFKRRYMGARRYF
jgi:hypothetical protein